LDRNRQQPTQILRDYDVEQEKFSAPCVLDNSLISATTISPTISVANEEATQTIVRVRRRPTWMKDCKVTGIEDPITHFSLSSDCDPTSFDSVVKEERWRKAMDYEIDAVERNDTWELSDLPNG